MCEFMTAELTVYVVTVVSVDRRKSAFAYMYKRGDELSRVVCRDKAEKSAADMTAGGVACVVTQTVDHVEMREGAVTSLDWWYAQKKRSPSTFAEASAALRKVMVRK